LLDLAHGGIVRTPVAVSPAVLVVRVSYECGCHMNRRDDRARYGIDEASGLCRNRFGPQLVLTMWRGNFAGFRLLSAMERLSITDQWVAERFGSAVARIAPGVGR